MRMMFEGKPYDLYFEWSDARIYCSELVWKIYRDAARVSRSVRVQKLREFDLTDPAVKAKMRERYGERPLDEPVISPAAMIRFAVADTIGQP